MLKTIKGDGLILAIDRKETAEPTIPVRWSLEKELVETLVSFKEEASRFNILFVIKDDRGSESRVLAPLDQEMTYLSFQRPGDNRVLATIVRGSIGYLRNQYLSRDRNFYRMPVLDYSGSDFLPHVEPVSLVRMVVNIPEGVFAPEPSAWMKWWVNLFYEDEPRDECGFGKRQLFAFTIQPAQVAIIVGFSFLATSLAVLGYFLAGRVKGFAFRQCFGFLRDPIFGWRSIFSMLDDTEYAFTPVVSFKGRKIRLLACVPFTPIYPVFIAALYFHTWIGLQTLGTLPMVVAAGVFIPVAVLGILDLMYYFLGNKAYDETMEQRRKQREEKESRLLEEKLNALVCQGDNTPSISSLPPKKRTWHLRFLALKAIVCRPYAR